jgi:hypothetical protein
MLWNHRVKPWPFVPQTRGASRQFKFSQLDRLKENGSDSSSSLSEREKMWFRPEDRLLWENCCPISLFVRKGGSTNDRGSAPKASLDRLSSDTVVFWMFEVFAFLKKQRREFSRINSSVREQFSDHNLRPFGCPEKAQIETPHSIRPVDQCKKWNYYYFTSLWISCAFYVIADITFRYAGRAWRRNVRYTCLDSAKVEFQCESPNPSPSSSFWPFPSQDCSLKCDTGYPIS